jgi:hypothetical protein
MTVDEYVAQVVADAPPLSQEIRSKLGVLLTQEPAEKGAAGS